MDEGALDLLVIGGGQAGPPLARAAAKAGMRVALAERRHLGGSCVNFGCTPTKAAIASARIAHLARRGAEFGVMTGPVRVDVPRVIRRARAMAQASRTALERGFGGEGQPRLLRAHARLEGRRADRFRVRVGDRVVDAKRVVVNTGTRTRFPSIEGLEASDPLDAGSWLGTEELPRRLLVLGGGPIGLEMSQLYRRLGSEVVLVEPGPQVGAREDDDVARALAGVLVDEGVEVLLGTRVREVRPHGGRLRVRVEGPAAREEVEADRVFVATGRRPNTDDLGLESVGVQMDEEGFLGVDGRLRTNVPGIWAGGDVRGGPMFTHTAWDDFRILEEEIVQGGGQRSTRRVVPYAIFTDPELGRVGLTEAQAREQVGRVRVGRFDMGDNGKATEIGETRGFVKVVVDPRTDRILGAAVLSVAGAELVHCFVDLMNARAPWTALRDGFHIHPTLAEAVHSAVLALEEEEDAQEGGAERDGAREPA